MISHGTTLIPSQTRVENTTNTIIIAAWFYAVWRTFLTRLYIHMFRPNRSRGIRRTPTHLCRIRTTKRVNGYVFGFYPNAFRATRKPQRSLVVSSVPCDAFHVPRRHTVTFKTRSVFRRTAGLDRILTRASPLATRREIRFIVLVSGIKTDLMIISRVRKRTVLRNKRDAEPKDRAVVHGERESASTKEVRLASKFYFKLHIYWIH